MKKNVFMNVKVLEEAGYESAMKGLSLNKKKNPEDMGKVAFRLSHYDCGHNKFLESLKVWLEVTAPRYWWSEADTYRLTTKQSNSTMHTLLQEIINFQQMQDLKNILHDKFNQFNDKEIKQLAEDITDLYFKRYYSFNDGNQKEFQLYNDKLINYKLYTDQIVNMLDVAYQVYKNDSLLEIQANNTEFLKLFEYIPNCIMTVIIQMTKIALDRDLSDSDKLVQIKQMLPEGFLQTRVWLVDYKTLRNVFKQRKDHRLPHWKMFIESLINQLQYPEFFDDIISNNNDN